MAGADFATKRKEWNACLAKSGGAPGKCEKIEKELRTLSKCQGVDACINETVALMKCTGTSSKVAGCGAEFLAMRECNRFGGKQLIPEAGGYAIASGKASLFEPAASSAVASTPPKRTLQGMQEFAREYATSLGMSPETVRF
eukprot:CAMPEP_0117519072 /NCGR_PEP_ID=MMETSP0784-20121206/32462_1 /TAXON_ID=39447 /ORGANISM="" /LENGTH=141 /DNA_ID=CAMNT_0005315019 /DNA_START=87 /DNA_END=512 /DNA_ORIENTATION=+